MQLTVVTTSGLPAFKLPCEPTDTIAAIIKSTAKKANVDKAIVKLSMGTRGNASWLNKKDSVEALGLQDGARLMLHIKNTPIIKGCVKPAPLPVHTFASEGYGFFMNIETPRGKYLFRTKVVYHEGVGSLIDLVRRRTECPNAVLKYRRIDGTTVKLEKGHKVKEYDLRADGVIVVYGIPGERAPKPPPTPVFVSRSFNSLTDPMALSPRPNSAGKRIWMATGPVSGPDGFVG